MKPDFSITTLFCSKYVIWGTENVDLELLLLIKAFVGCILWQYLGDIEEHLGVTIDQVDVDLKVPLDQFDGKVTYGQKRRNTG